MNKTHYRKVFKSDHLGVADLEDLIEAKTPLVFTIKEVKQEFDTIVAGKKINANIAYFNEPIKPMVLNATNSKLVKLFNNNSPFIEDWKNTMVELYIDSAVKMKGDIVGGVRIRHIQPSKDVKNKPEFTEANFEKAKKAKASIEQIQTVYSITQEMMKKYAEYYCK